MTPLQRFNQQIPNGLANAFRNNWTEISGMTDSYFRMLLGFAELDDEKKQWFVDAAVSTFINSDPKIYETDTLRRHVNQLAVELIGKEVL